MFQDLTYSCPMQPKSLADLAIAHLLPMHLKHERAEQEFVGK